jgi:hypothetical protein
VQICIKAVGKKRSGKKHYHAKTDPEIRILVDRIIPVYVQVKQYICTNDTDKHPFSIDISSGETFKVVIPIRNGCANEREHKYAS